MIQRMLVAIVAFSGVLAALIGSAAADPCGMVPPIYTGPDIPLVRVGEQKTYVFFQDGIETFVIRPGFDGKVDEFGMLIPFPTPPAVRKVPDNIFQHIAAAVDPPEVVVDLRPPPPMAAMAPSGAVPTDSAVEESLEWKDTVRVIREEAVGMYEVAVLEAGSARALKRWMDDHGYVYPIGMDKACDEYVADGWCFVAVKTRVGPKSGVDPQPGQRDVDSKLPTGATFDGFVQAMGFRFRSDKLVVPMRLSAFNKGELHNIVYVLTDEPSQIKSISSDKVVRQIPGNELFRNVTAPLPMRIIGGDEADIPDWRRQSLPQERDPVPHNGMARELFAADLLAVMHDRLAHPYEEAAKEMLRIDERLGLRGNEIDVIRDEAFAADRDAVVQEALDGLTKLTLTVIDGDFPREVLARENLEFDNFMMPDDRNSPRVYNAVLMGPAPQREGTVVVSAPPGIPPALTTTRSSAPRGYAEGVFVVIGVVAFVVVLLIAITMVKRRSR